MNSLTFQHIDDRFYFITEIDNFIKEKIHPLQKNNLSKINNDTLIYILRHLLYGKKLINESPEEDKGKFYEFYIDKIQQFSLDQNWPGLLVTFEINVEKNYLNFKNKNLENTINNIQGSR